ncbi:MAG: hypothetical protein N2255_08370 [Kiritimatiellae bacterium]|nr:hypothetical protein [Kiritimatiellia bacterium]
MIRIIGSLLIVASMIRPMTAADATFTIKPSVTRQGNAARINFAVSQPTDVEIAILDGTGKIVRHLAAGLAGGERAVPPLKPNSLTQTVEWDLKDDEGREVSGSVSVRVRLGMKASFGRIIGASPYVGQATDQPYRGALQGIAIDRNGNLFVKMMSDTRSHGNSGLWPWQLRKFDPEGKYVKTLLPYPPSTDRAKAPGMTLLNTPDGSFTPANQSSLYPVFFVFGSVLLPYVRTDSSVVFVNTRARCLNFFKTDGSNELRTIKMWPDSVNPKFPLWLEADVAFSPDGRYAYYSGLAGTVYDGKSPEDVDPAWPNGRVYRHDLSNPDSVPVPFFDIPLPDWNTTKYWMPSAWDHRCASGGVDVDPKGNVYIGDLVNQQVIVVSPEGKMLRTIKCPWPDRIKVHPVTGDIYVIVRVVSRGGRPPDKLVKISAKDGQIVAEYTMKQGGNTDFTLDARGPVPVLWVLAKGRGPSGQALLRIEDRGAEFAVTRDVFDRDHDAIAFVGNLAVDHTRNEVYITDTATRVWKFNGLTGEGGRFVVGASDLTVWRDKIYRIIGWHSGIARFTLDGKPDPLTDVKVQTRTVEGQPGVMEFGSYYGRAGRGCSVGGITVDAKGRLWALQEGSIDGLQTMFVKAYEPDGTPVQFEKKIIQGNEEIPVAISGFDNRAGCIRVDRQGNIYVGWGQTPRGHKPPPGYEKDEAYSAANGMILKFGPNGGHRPSPAITAKQREDPALGFTGVLQIYPDFAPFSAWRCDGSCICCKPRFDVDEFGRLIVPNALTFSVTVYDNAANPLLKFGHYGNFDAQGPQSQEPKPEIPLGWPNGAGICGDHVYVGDVLNHRIVRVDLKWLAEEVCPLR